MTEKPTRTARCLCGAVGLSIAADTHSVGACHCGMCRKWGGGPLLAMHCGRDVSIDGESSVSVYDSSAWAERGFCSKCGTHLFYRLKGSGEYAVPAGLFDDQSDLVFEEQIFVDCKPPYYAFANDTRNMTEAEVFAKYAPPAD